MKQITIIGGGVIGFTVALYLQNQGFAATVVAKEFPSPELSREDNPDFSSLFPAASVILHSVMGPNVGELFSASQRHFGDLSSNSVTGVRSQRHYEMWHPGESGAGHDFSRMKNAEAYSPKKHPDFEGIVGFELDGWAADIYFVETPTYLTWLRDEFLRVGGKLEKRTLLAADIPGITGEFIVNCSGLGAFELFGDRSIYPAAGQLLLVQNVPFPPPILGDFSYSVDPPDSIYRMGGFYFYPRSLSCHPLHRGWLLGGTFEESIRDAATPWKFPASTYELVHGVPEPMYRFNQKILLALTGIDIESYPSRVMRGYRPARVDGIRLEREDRPSGPPIIHSYGYGGSGVTLSWGAAERVLQLLRE